MSALKRRHKIFIFTILCFIVSNLYAKTQEIDLTVSYKKVHYADKTVTAIAVNDQIPGPLLHFQEGDEVIIRVHNRLKVGTAIHWHGLLVPWRMDGVEHVTQEPIAPNETFVYQFKIKQSGTYWYHAHADLQEQQGLYGPMIIDPKTPSPYHYTQDFPIVLSDWSNENPDVIYKHLKQNGNYYGGPLQPTLMQFFEDRSSKPKEQHSQIFRKYWDMQIMRMSVYDLSDVQYDAFLLNGKTAQDPWQKSVKVGDTVRLRFIGAGASTVFNLKIDDASLKVVEVQGNDVKPYIVHQITLAPGQTIDVLLDIQKNKPYTIYAESLDTSGYAVGILNPTKMPLKTAPTVKPCPKPEPMGISGMSGMNGNMNMSMMMPPQDQDAAQQWQALKPTNDPNKPVTVLTMRLGGYMDRYMWFINGLPEYLAKPILIEPGRRYRFVFVNETMMHHPMHLHGHWMILRNGHGAYDPLVHTLDVGPFQTVTADFDADAGSGWWYMHCHNLFHMKAGMARVMHYDTPDDLVKKTENNSLTHTADPYITGQTAHPPEKYLSNDWQYGHDFGRNVDQISLTTMYGGDYNKAQFYVHQAQITQGILTEADVDIFAWHVLNDFWAIKGGANYVYKPASYWEPGLGLEGTAPFFITTNIRTYWYSGSGKVDADFSRNTDLTAKWSLFTELEVIAATGAVEAAQIGQGLNSIAYTIGPSYQLLDNLALQLQYQYTRSYGNTADLLRAHGDSPNDSLLTLGLELVF